MPPSDRDLAQQYSEELVELVARTMSDHGYAMYFEHANFGNGESLPDRDAARDLLDALSSAGRLVPDGSEVREEWGTDHFGIESGRRMVRLCADLDAAKRRFEDLDEVWGHHAQLIRRTVITTPWTPAQRSGEAAQEET